MQTTQKEIREFWATEITCKNFNYIRKCHLKKVAISQGVFGVNGVVFYNENDKELYKISSLNSFLLRLL